MKGDNTMKNKVITAIGIGIAAFMSPAMVAFAEEPEVEAPATEEPVAEITGEVNLPEDAIDQAINNGGSKSFEESSYNEDTAENGNGNNNENSDVVDADNGNDSGNDNKENSNDEYFIDNDQNDRIDLEINEDEYKKVDPDSVKTVAEDYELEENEAEVGSMTITDVDEESFYDETKNAEDEVKNTILEYIDKYGIDNVKIVPQTDEWQEETNDGEVNGGEIVDIIVTTPDGIEHTYQVNKSFAKHIGTSGGNYVTQERLDELNENSDSYIYKATGEAYSQSFDDEEKALADYNEQIAKFGEDKVSFTSAGTKIENARIVVSENEAGDKIFVFESGTKTYTDGSGTPIVEDLAGKEVNLETVEVNSYDDYHANEYGSEILYAITVDGVRYQMYENEEAAKNAIHNMRSTGPELKFDDTKDQEIPWIWNFDKYNELFVDILKTDPRFTNEDGIESWSSDKWKDFFDIKSSGTVDSEYDLAHYYESQLWNYHSNIKGEFLAYRYYFANDGTNHNSLIELTDDVITEYKKSGQLQEYMDSGLIYEVTDKQDPSKPDSPEKTHYYLVLGQYDQDQFTEYQVGQAVEFGDEEYIITGIWRSAQCDNVIKDMLFVKPSMNFEGTTNKYTVVADAYQYDVYKAPYYAFKASLTTVGVQKFVGTIAPEPDVPVTPPPVTPDDPSVPVPPTPETPTTPGTPDTPSTPDTPTTVAAAPADGAAVLGARRETGDMPAVLGARRGRTGDESKTASTRAAAMASAAAVIGLMGISRKKRED